MTDAVRAAYDAKAELYAEFALDDLDRVPSDREWLAAFAELAQLHIGLVADLGCGPGHIVSHLSELGLTTVGYDISSALIAKARSVFPNLEFHVADIRTPAAAGDALAGIVSRYSLIHTRPEQLVGVFRTWCSALRPGAPLLLSFFAASSAANHGSPFDHAVVTAYALFPATLQAELEQAGFGDCKIGTRRPLADERSLDHGTILARRAAG